MYPRISTIPMGLSVEQAKMSRTLRVLKDILFHYEKIMSE